MTSKTETQEVSARFFEVVDKYAGTKRSGKMTMTEIAAKLNTSSTNLERERITKTVTVGQLSLLCKHFKADPAWLLTGNGVNGQVKNDVLKRIEKIEKHLKIK